MNAISRWLKPSQKKAEKIKKPSKPSIVERFQDRFQSLISKVQNKQPLNLEVEPKFMPPRVLQEIIKDPEILEELKEQKYEKLPFEEVKPETFQIDDRVFHEIISEEQKEEPTTEVIGHNFEVFSQSELNTDPSIDHMPTAVRKYLNTDESFRVQVQLFGLNEAIKLNGLKPLEAQSNKTFDEPNNTSTSEISSISAVEPKVDQINKAFDNRLTLEKDDHCKFGLFSVECGTCEHCLNEIELNKEALDQMQVEQYQEEEFNWVSDEESTKDINLEQQIKLNQVIEAMRAQIPQEDVNDSNNWEDSLKLSSKKNKDDINQDQHQEISSHQQELLMDEEIEHTLNISEEIIPVYLRKSEPVILNQQEIKSVNEPTENSQDQPTEKVSSQEAIEQLLKENNLDWIKKHVKKKSLFSKFKSNFTEKLSFKNLPKKILSSLILGGAIYSISQILAPIILTGIISKASISIISLMIGKSLGLSFSYQVIKDLEFNKLIDNWSDNASLQNKLLKSIEKQDLLKAHEVITELKKLNGDMKIYDQLQSVKTQALSQTYKKLGIISLFSAGLVGGVGLFNTFENTEFIKETSSIASKALSKGREFFGSFFSPSKAVESQITSNQLASLDIVSQTKDKISQTLNTPINPTDFQSTPVANITEIQTISQSPELGSNPTLNHPTSTSTPSLDPLDMSVPKIDAIQVNADLSNLPDCTITEIQSGQKICVNTNSSRLLARTSDLQTVASKLKRGFEATLTGNYKEGVSKGIKAIYVEITTAKGENLWVVKNLIKAA